MNKVIVFRIENKRRQGPYYVDDIRQHDWSDQDHGDKNHPISQHDGIDFIKNIHTCGFISMDSLINWFNDTELFKLFDLGFQIVSLLVDESDVLYGLKQIAFIDPRDNEMRIAA